MQKRSIYLYSIFIMSITYSIIIPHHNIPKLLQRCLNSIPIREDLEVIVVDDASDQQYKPLLKKVCTGLTQKHVRLIELDTNGGGGKARNEGLKVACGKFVLFADADDFFNYCIDEILDEYANSGADIVFFKGNCVDSETYVSGNRLDYINKKIDSALNESPESDFDLRFFFQIPVCKIIRRSLISEYNIKFDETSIRNDVTFSYTLGYFAKKIIADKRAIYCATTREGSVSTFRSSDKILTTIDVLGRAVVFFRNNCLDAKGYETILAHNLYILLRRKDYNSFELGFKTLERLGFDRKESEKNYSLRIAETAFSSCIWSIVFAPSFDIKKWCTRYIYKSLFKY